MRANHSSDPNTDWYPEQKVLRANSVILPGEEITYEYTKEVAPSYIKECPPSWI